MSDKAAVPGAVPAKKMRAPLAEVKGKATYVLKAQHYRDGVMYEVGDKVTVIDERPSKKWTRVPYDASAAVLQKGTKPSDVEVPEFEEPTFEAVPATTPAPSPSFEHGKPDKKRANERDL